MRIVKDSNRNLILIVIKVYLPAQNEVEVLQSSKCSKEDRMHESCFGVNVCLVL